MFRREQVRAVYIQGSAFHRYDRKRMQQELEKAQDEGRFLSHFGPEANHLDKLESLFFEYATVGRGSYRYYLHAEEIAAQWQQAAGTFTPWEKLKNKSDLLLYRGLHGAAISGDIDISRYPDLIIGVVPNVNLEWMRKINRDMAKRNYTAEEVQQSILRRMHDYVHHITPQFTRTHVNFQLVPMVDTSDPFALGDTPSDDECHVVIHFQRGVKPDFMNLQRSLPKAYMSRPNTIVVPGDNMVHAMEVVMMPMIHDLVTKSRELRQIETLPKKSKCGILGQLSQSLA